MLSNERKARIKAKVLNTRRGYYPEEPSAQMDFPNPTHELIRSKINAARLDSFPIEIDEDDLLAGRLCVIYETKEEKAAREAREKQNEAGQRIDGTRATATGHRVLDYKNFCRKA